MSGKTYYGDHPMYDCRSFNTQVQLFNERVALMIKKYVVTLLIPVIMLGLIPGTGHAQNHDYLIYLTISTSGGGAGMKLRWDTQSKWRKSISLEFGGVRSENEFTMMDYYSGYPYKINQQRYIILTPVYFGLQRIVFDDVIENNVKPFVIGEVGPVLGAWFPVGHGLGGNIKRGTTGLTVGGFLGAGLEFGSGKPTKYSFSLGYRFVHFFETLGDQQTGEKRFDAFLLRFGIITNF